MELLTVARKAKLGYRINEGFKQSKEKIQLAKDYNNKIYGILEGDKKQLEFHFATYLTGVLAILEANISDTLLEYLICFPGHLDEKTIKLDDLARSGSPGQVVKTLAEKTVNNFSYKKFLTLLI